MSSLMPWEPRGGISLRDMMDRLFEDAFIQPRDWMSNSMMGMGTLPLDMYETKDDVVVKTALPGVKPDDVDVTITGDTLTIHAETKAENQGDQDKQGKYLRREQQYGEFTRTVTLPTGLKTDQAEASFENGMLSLRIPKSEQQKPKTIQVKAKSK